ncbi:MAG: low-density lipoprotein receptor class A repeat-containing protein [Candidatus Endonucleobacter bathymodioli]|uniref:Low-density lipoprotein receptor class A repeat-containing protein n=1 Tax=Candidatus Endonucleibacter bathymodioli TaxID=539814 RepID=A0AA90ST52_9GAMM|nr:low-density lipoprotein receptor class A repeat-containing protein [Candidatus Endonucleobacter bathymodioli]
MGGGYRSRPRWISCDARRACLETSFDGQSEKQDQKVSEPVHQKEATTSQESGVNTTTKSCFKLGSDEKLFVCNDMQTVLYHFRCDGKVNCRDKSDDIWNCPANGTIITEEIFAEKNFTEENFTGASVLGALAIAVGAYIVVVLVKYRDKKSTRGMLAWLASPITEPVSYLRRHCVYYLVPPRENNEGASRNSYFGMRSCVEAIMHPVNYLLSYCGCSPVGTDNDYHCCKK